MSFAFVLPLILGVVFAGNTEGGITVTDAESSSEGRSRENSTTKDGVGHVVADKVSEVLPQVFGNYGHLEALADPSDNALLQGLLPRYEEELRQERAQDDTTKDLAALLESAVGEYQAQTSWRSQRDAQKSESEAERSDTSTEKTDQIAGTSGRDARHAEWKSRRARQAANNEAKRQAQNELDAQKNKELLANRDREHKEFMKKHSAATQAMHERHQASRERQAKSVSRVEQILLMVHEQIEKESHNFTDQPFWGDFFLNTSARESWNRLSLEDLGPSLNLAALRPEDRILVLEPSESLGVAAQLAESFQATGALAASHSYGAEPDGTFDMVLELGLLDAIVMGGTDDVQTHRLEELRHASERLSGLLRPGGTWVSVSSVPPGLRLPLLERLAGGAFDVPSEDVGTHIVKLGAAKSQDVAADVASPPGRLRGTATLDKQHVANLLLYGHKEPHVFAYRLPRIEASWTDHALGADGLSALEGIVAAQRPARDDL